mmetsp:Transcript_130395/g.243962  ORF Transcript_130395/g.243962 Transcript_130395/m.243962 type:complete len:227 (+) Transcript_130395:22-702(+)
MALRGHRLGTILRKFGMSSADCFHQDSKWIITSLKAEYKKQAMVSHPDLASESNKAEASKKFIQMRQDYEEAMKLLEGGIRPVDVQHAAHPSQASGGPSASMRYPEAGQSWQYQESKRQEPEFDFLTVLKGRLLVFSTLFTFYYFFPEFLALSAGSTMKWHAGSGVRRFSEAPKDEAPAAPPKKKVEVKVQRKVDPFYEKRGIKKQSTKYSPRGSAGPKLSKSNQV